MAGESQRVGASDCWSEVRDGGDEESDNSVEPRDHRFEIRDEKKGRVAQVSHERHGEKSARTQRPELGAAGSAQGAKPARPKSVGDHVPDYI